MYVRNTVAERAMLFFEKIILWQTADSQNPFSLSSLETISIFI